MSTDGTAERGGYECDAEKVRDALFAVDLKRLVRASQEQDSETTEEIRTRYLPE